MELWLPDLREEVHVQAHVEIHIWESISIGMHSPSASHIGHMKCLLGIYEHNISELLIDL